MERVTRWLCRPILCAVALLAMSIPAVAQANGRRDKDRHGREHVVRAGLPPGAVGHIFVLELENKGEETTFGPGSPATFLNGTLVPQGELLQHEWPRRPTAPARCCWWSRSTRPAVEMDPPAAARPGRCGPARPALHPARQRRHDRPVQPLLGAAQLRGSARADARRHRRTGASRVRRFTRAGALWA
jgi:hypothetical protein